MDGRSFANAGSAILDSGAVQKVIHEGKSLLPIGVIRIKGEFGRGEIISCLDESGQGNRKRPFKLFQCGSSADFTSQVIRLHDDSGI